MEVKMTMSEYDNLKKHQLLVEKVVDMFDELCKIERHEEESEVIDGGKVVRKIAVFEKNQAIEILNEFNNFRKYKPCNSVLIK